MRFKPILVITADNNTKPAEDAEAKEEKFREQVIQAQALLVSLAADAGAYSDQKLRARILAKIADAFWDTEPEQSRTLSRKGWDAAVIADAESQKAFQEELSQQRAKSGSGGIAAASPPDLRNEVLRLVTKRDLVLADEFVAERKAKESAATANRNNQPDSERDTEPNSMWRAYFERWPGRTTIEQSIWRVYSSVRRPTRGNHTVTTVPSNLVKLKPSNASLYVPF